MIYYVISHEDGAKEVATRQPVRRAYPDEYMPAETITAFIPDATVENLIDAFSESEEIHGYITNDRRLFVHPDVLLAKMREFYQEYFANLAKRFV